MPPKKQLKQPNSKPKPLVTKNSATLIDNPDPNSDIAQQFELELCWCIQQLQSGLKLGKLNSTQVKDHTKALNSLMSNSTSIVKKRQVMRLSFGDYRTKMAQEDKKFKAANTKTKIAPVQADLKSVFVKKAVQNEFKFNFPEQQHCDEAAEPPISNSNVQNLDKADKTNNFHFKHSSNTFKFNFNNET